MDSGRKPAVLYRDLDLQIVPDGDASFSVLAHAPTGEACERLSEDPSACLKLLSNDENGVHRLSPPVRESFDRERGECLFQSLIRGDVRALFDRAHGESENAGEGLRIRLRFDPREGRLARLASLPWELLYDRRTEQFLSLDPRTPVVRLYDVHHRPSSSPRGPGLRILLAGAEVRHQPRLDLDEERRRIEKAFDGRDGVAIETIANTRRSLLVDRLQDGAFDVLHLMMHGDRDYHGDSDHDEQGCLLFEDDDGRADLVSGSDLARQVRAAALPRLVVVNACMSAEGTAASPLTSVAAALVLGGCPAVVAMTAEIGDVAAVAFTGRLYERLAKGESVEEAVVKARLAIDAAMPERHGHWSRPAVFLSPHAVNALLPPRAEIPDDGAAVAEPGEARRTREEKLARPGSVFSVSARRIGTNINIHAPGSDVVINDAADDRISTMRT
jgi:hypothetical protein